MLLLIPVLCLKASTRFESVTPVFMRTRFCADPLGGLRMGALLQVLRALSPREESELSSLKPGRQDVVRRAPGRVAAGHRTCFCG